MDEYGKAKVENVIDNWGSITRFVESSCAGRDVVGHFYLFCNVVVYHGCRRRMRNWIRNFDLCYTIMSAIARENL